LTSENGRCIHAEDCRDRRVVMARIALEAQCLLEAPDKPSAEVDRQPLRHLREQRWRTLLKLLESARKQGRENFGCITVLTTFVCTYAVHKTYMHWVNEEACSAAERGGMT
jgi:hypothetical protein